MTPTPPAPGRAACDLCGRDISVGKHKQDSEHGLMCDFEDPQWSRPAPGRAEAHEWKLYSRLGEIEAREWTATDSNKYAFGDLSISVSQADAPLARGTDKGFVARNPANHADQWYIAPDYFAKHYAPVSRPAPAIASDVVDMPRDRTAILADIDAVVSGLAAKARTPTGPERLASFLLSQCNSEKPPHGPRPGHATVEISVDQAREIASHLSPAPAIVAEVGDEVKRYRLSLRDGVVEDDGSDYYPSTTSLPMVLASDYDAALRTLAEVQQQRDEARRFAGTENLRCETVTQQAQAAYQVFRDTERKLEAERDAANELRNQIAAENKRLFAKNLEATQRAEQAERLLREIDEYLSGNLQNSIWSGSRLHQDVKRVLALPAPATNATGED